MAVAKDSLEPSVVVDGDGTWPAPASDSIDAPFVATSGEELAGWMSEGWEAIPSSSLMKVSVTDDDCLVMGGASRLELSSAQANCNAAGAVK